MKLGFISAILDQMSFEEMIDTAAGLGFSCVEVACWPRGKAERRYAGVSHIDVSVLTDKEAARILDYCKARKVEISSLAYYPNTMDGDPEKRAANIAHLKQVIAASHRLGVNLVTTFVGRDQTKTVEENLELRAGSVARRTEFGQYAGHLAQAVPNLTQPEFWPELRSQPFCLAEDGLYYPSV